MTVSIYTNVHFLQKRCISNKNVCFPLKSDLIENKGAYRLLVSNITVLKKNTMEHYTKIGV